MLAYISGSVDEELLLQNEYLAAESMADLSRGRVRSYGDAFSSIRSNPSPRS